jgi:predicted ArsR family transcriptional regulator
MPDHQTDRTPEAAVSEAGMRIVRLLVGKPPQSVADLIEATGVTRTAVTEQLNELVAAGFVERTTEPPVGRGRPRHLYSATHNALLLLFASNQRVLVPAIWAAIAEICGEDLKRKVLKRVGRKMADHYKPRITGKTARERLVQFAEALREEGCLVEVDETGNGQMVLEKRSCPFISMFEDSRSVCCVDRELLRLVVRAPVRQTRCRHDGYPCCYFAVQLKNKSKR